jgi:hypothetical protein
VNKLNELEPLIFYAKSGNVCHVTMKSSVTDNEVNVSFGVNWVDTASRADQEEANIYLTGVLEKMVGRGATEVHAAEASSEGESRDWMDGFVKDGKLPSSATDLKKAK